MAVVLPAAALASEFHGHVRYGSVPVPGATVTLTQGDKQFSTITDSLGIYQFADVPDGTWKISISLRGFAPMDNTVTVAANAPQGDFTLDMLAMPELLAMAQPEAAPAPKPLQPRAAETKDEARPKAADAKTAKPEGPQAPQPPAPSEDSDRANDGLLINGSESNAATSQYSMSPAIGNRRPGTKALYNGSFGAFAQNAIFNAKPYSLTGLQLPKDGYNRITMVATFGGPIRIPPIFYHGPNFFVAYQWTRNGTANTGTGLVPTQAERDGDLSSITNAQGQPVPIYNPATGVPYAGALPVSPQAAALLALYPLPNVSGSTRYNYEASLASETHQDSLQSRLDKSVGHRDSFYGGFGFQNSRTSTENLFGFVDSVKSLGIDTNVNWQHRFARQVFATLGYHLTRQRTLLTPEFAGQTNISGNAGVTGNDQDPREWGPPALGFSSITGLSDANSQFNRNRTDQGSFKLTTTRGRHSLQAGGDFRRQEYNELQQSNPRGTFTFTGAATSATGATSTTSGSDLADFLVGTPDTSALAYGNADKYLRQSVSDLYVNDDWRVRPELTLNVGFRWEYGSPITELKGRLVNLDLAKDFSSSAPVLANAPKGSVTGTTYPSSLVQPDKHGFEPRVALAWRPIPASTLVVRAGYGIYDDTSVYLAAAQSMSQQAPLSTSLSVQRSSTCPLTLANGFLNCTGTTADTYAVDPNLRVGYVQSWQVSAQRDMPFALVMTATYLGTKGTHGTQEFLPNTYPIGATNPCPQCPVGFTYRTSGGNLERNAGQLQLRRRLRGGFTATLQYTYAKAVDDDAQVGGAGHTVAASATASSTSSTSSSPAILAQDWLHLRAERSLSSFDQRHQLNVILQYTTGMGAGGGTLMSGWRGRVLKEWTILTQYTGGTGLPETPVYLAAVPNTGVTGTIRPNRTSAPIYDASSGYFLNSAAYTTPTSGQWGTAGRNSILGPGTFTMNAALQRTLRMPSNTSMDVRFEANNVLNHATFTSWNTITNSSTFGLPASVNAMRSFQISGRWRF
ncbi:Carboxypeptidase regulatory-like domain-containing protein [Bryocella elongata]|uniref:Carboxypeptidase regulatory-like domain-containing protein n=1 Tax=Bryocella elongata TaxID=863522 RepID=A0A1H5XYQ8_9BACT|nr:TonB-dependent receptor [Bryocella elongata]SEG16406.1 Carboxypeptidase regulatory-like domain-containing protein [Bryocella elongata]